MTEVLYNFNETTRSERDIEALVESTILSFASDNLAKFGSDLRYSKLVKAIDDSESAIISNNTELRIIKNVEVDTGIPFRIAFSFENELKKEVSTTRKIYEDTTSTLESSLFTFNLNDIDYLAKIKDDTQGNLMIVSVVNGVVQLLKDKIGTVDYTNGTISIGAIVYDDVGLDNELEIYGRTKKLDIETNANKVLQVVSGNLVVSARGIRA